MAIFGSYLGKERRLFGESINIAVLDTAVAMIAGLIIFPSCFAFGVAPNEGPGLIFVTLPNIFNEMPLGRIWGFLFSFSFPHLLLPPMLFFFIHVCPPPLT